MPYVSPTIPILADDLETESFDVIQAERPGFDPTIETLPEVQVVAATSQTGAEVIGMLYLTTEQFTILNAALRGVTIKAAIPAVCSATWTMVDSAGYVIDAGTIVVLTASDGSQSLWATADTSTVLPGSDTVDIAMVAVLGGTQNNGLTGTLELVAPRLTFVQSITLDAPTANGVDEETYSAFLDRASLNFQTTSDRAITGRDFEIAALQITGVGRALAIETYNTVGPDPAAAGHTTVAVITPTGSHCAADVLAQVAAIPTIAGVVVHAINPTDSTINVDVTVSTYPGLDPDYVQQLCSDTLAAWLDPLSFGGTPTGERTSWSTVSTIALSDVVAILGHLPEVRTVDYTTVKLSIGGASTTAADLSLPGPAPLAHPGVINVTVA